MRRAAVTSVLLAALTGALAAPAAAVSVPHPQPAKQLTVTGFVIGKLGKGNHVRIGAVAGSPKSWLTLHTITLSFLLHGQPIQQISYDVKGSTLATGSSKPVPVQPPRTLGGSFLTVNTHSVRIVRSTFSFHVTMWATVREGLPKGTAFRLVVRDDNGKAAAAREPIQITGGFLSWGTFLMGLLAALAIGWAVGAGRAARKYRQRHPSIWDVLDRRLREQRAQRPILVPAPTAVAS